MIESTVLNPETYPKPDSLILELFYHSTSIVVTPEQTPFHLGRDNADSGLSISCEFTSRQHCAIEFHGGKFLLNDFSRNGTFVQLNRTTAFRVQNETSPLIGSGCFKLGAVITSDDDPERILFRIKTFTKKL